MIFSKTNSIWSLCKVPFKYCPLFAILLMFQKLIYAIIPAINVLIIAHFIDTATEIFRGNLSYSAIYVPLLYIVSILAFQLLFGTLLGYIISKKSIKLRNRIEIECIEKQACVAFEHIDNSESYMMIKKVLGEVPSHIFTIYNDVLSAISIVVRFLSIMIVFASNNLWWIGILIIIASAPMIIITYKNGKKIYQFYKENFPGKMEMYHSAYILKASAVTDERTLFGFSDAINSKWKNMQLELYNQKKHINKKILLNRYVAHFINLLFAIIIITSMTFLVLFNKMEGGLYIALVTNVITLIDYVVSTTMNLANNLAQEREFIKDLNEICNYRYNTCYLCLPEKEAISVETIEFINVTFIYPGTHRKVLDNVSFKMIKGIHYAFVGKNGAGKSTIVKLLTGLYDSYDGIILVNGKNLKEYSYAQIKGMFGIIYQDYAKYELTLKDNVRIGDINAIIDETNNDYKQKLCDVGLINLISQLPKGSDTFLGKTEENGQDVSGGEWQRIAIARLLMKKANFLILDELTASLDPIEESNLYKQFTYICQNKTTLLITHRLGSIKTVDYIYVIDNGKIIESGTHIDLMKEKGLYEKLYSEQKGWYE